MKEHVTEKNPTGEVRQCGRSDTHHPHEWQADFGAYFDVYCPGKVASEVVLTQFQKQVITETLVEHRLRHHGLFCMCGFKVPFSTPDGERKALAEHQVEMIAEALK